ncbi:MAG TPA: hypothetical protein VHT92_08530 [Candidatus Cybelea sp.]|jgi:hypothetical protein|nr:hypothetical protein [Candidatus Cybelea sp.]
MYVRRSWFFAGAALLALAGCGGSAAVTPSGGAAESASAFGSAGAMACGIPNYYRFGGSCVSGRLMREGTTYKLAAYRGIGASFTLPPENKARKFTFTFADATGKGDIGKLHGQKFPLYPNPCGDASCPGTAFLYVGLGLTGPGPLLASGPSIFTYRKSGGYPGATCGEAELTGGKWYAFGNPAVPKGDRVTFNSPIAYVTGAITIAVYCE